MEPLLRLETKNDYFEVENLTREAFWNLYVPGCDEHYLTHIIRQHQDFIPELDYVAVLDDSILGSIMYTKSFLISEDNETVEIASFGPLCVHPNYQRKGIGTKLIEKTARILKDRGTPAVVIYGDPHNYCKHGFKNGLDLDVSDMNGDYPLGLLVLELQEGFFGTKKWKVKQSDVFTFDNTRVEEFDKKFGYKEKKTQDSQELFKIQIRAYLRNFS